MKKTAKRAWICYILIICFFLSGMCCEGAKTDPFLSCDHFSSQPDSFSIRRQKNPLRHDIITEKLMSGRIPAYYLSGKNKGAEKEAIRLKTGHFYLLPKNYAAPFSFCHGLLFFSGKQTVTYSSLVIIHYIHNQDGDKTNHLSYLREKAGKNSCLF